MIWERIMRLYNDVSHLGKMGQYGLGGKTLNSASARDIEAFNGFDLDKNNTNLKPLVDIESLKESFQSSFTQMAKYKERFYALLDQAFGSNYDRDAAEKIRQAALKGDFSWLPDTAVLDSNEFLAASLNGRDTEGGIFLGAFDKSNHSILINNSVLSNEGLANSVYAEEAGHALDNILNRGADAKGDEGAIFSRLLSGETLTVDQLSSLRSENDHGVLGGKYVEFDYLQASPIISGGWDWLTKTPDPEETPSVQETIGYFLTMALAFADHDVKLGLDGAKEREADIKAKVKAIVDAAKEAGHKGIKDGGLNWLAVGSGISSEPVINPATGDLIDGGAYMPPYMADILAYNVSHAAAKPLEQRTEIVSQYSFSKWKDQNKSLLLKYDASTGNDETAKLLLSRAKYAFNNKESDPEVYRTVMDEVTQHYENSNVEDIQKKMMGVMLRSFDRETLENYVEVFVRLVKEQNPDSTLSYSSELVDKIEDTLKADTPEAKQQVEEFYDLWQQLGGEGTENNSAKTELSEVIDKANVTKNIVEMANNNEKAFYEYAKIILGIDADSDFTPDQKTKIDSLLANIKGGDPLSYKGAMDETYELVRSLEPDVRTSLDNRYNLFINDEINEKALLSNLERMAIEDTPAFHAYAAKLLGENYNFNITENLRVRVADGESNALINVYDLVTSQTNEVQIDLFKIVNESGAKRNFKLSYFPMASNKAFFHKATALLLNDPDSVGTYNEAEVENFRLQVVTAIESEDTAQLEQLMEGKHDIVKNVSAATNEAFFSIHQEFVVDEASRASYKSKLERIAKSDVEFHSYVKTLLGDEYSDEMTSDIEKWRVSIRDKEEGYEALISAGYEYHEKPENINKPQLEHQLNKFQLEDMLVDLSKNEKLFTQYVERYLQAVGHPDANIPEKVEVIADELIKKIGSKGHQALDGIFDQQSQFYNGTKKDLLGIINLGKVEADFKARFSELAQTPDKFNTLIETTFGESYNKTNTEEIRKKISQGDFSWMPEIKVLDKLVFDQATLNGSSPNSIRFSGAYDGESIFLNKDILLDSEKLANVFASEMGHALDKEVNGDHDVKGDEGEIFQRLFFGEEINEAQLTTLRSKEDHGVLGGRDVEFYTYSIPEGGDWSITDIDNAVISDALEWGIPSDLGITSVTSDVNGIDNLLGSWDGWNNIFTPSSLGFTSIEDADVAGIQTGNVSGWWSQASSYELYPNNFRTVTNIINSDDVTNLNVNPEGWDGMIEQGYLFPTDDIMNGIVIGPSYIDKIAPDAIIQDLGTAISSNAELDVNNVIDSVIPATFSTTLKADVSTGNSVSMTYKNNRGEAPDSVAFVWQENGLKHSVEVSTDGEVKTNVDGVDGSGGSIGTSGVSGGGVSANGSTISNKVSVTVGTRSTGTVQATMTTSSKSPLADDFGNETTVYEQKGQLTITGTLSPKLTANILSSGASGLGAALGKIAGLAVLPPNLKVLFGGAAGIADMGAFVLKNQDNLTLSFSADYNATMYSGYSGVTGMEDYTERYLQFNNNPAFIYSLPDL